MKRTPGFVVGWILTLVVALFTMSVVAPWPNAHGSPMPAPTAPTSITAQTPKGPTGTVTSGQLTLTLTAADVSNGNSFKMSGKEVLFVYNSDASPHTITLTSVADNLGRTGDITSYSVAATTLAAYSFRGDTQGWKQTNGTMLFTANDATVKFAVVTFP